MAADPVAASNIVNAEHLGKAYGTRIVLDDLSLGLAQGDVIGVVGRNGDGKSTLLGLLTGSILPDEGKVTQTRSTSIGVLAQAERIVPGQSVRDLVLDGEPDHVWASDPLARPIVEQMLADIDLDAQTANLSGGERRRAALVALMLGNHDLLVLDEPTNHLDVEAVSWLAQHLRTLQQRGTAMLVVSHDRWFLDEVCTHIWEVHDATVDAYDGGYSAYTLARVERERQAAANEARRQNLARKELAWLRRGAPARTSKPKFRIEAANALIADVPEPRDKLSLARFSASRLGKDVLDLKDVTLTLPDGRTLLDHLTWSIGPGERIGLIGVNGAGKSTLLNLLDRRIEPTSGRVKHGKTLRMAHLTQEVHELDGDERVLDSVKRLKEETRLETGREATAANLLEEFGFSGQRLVTRVGELSSRSPMCCSWTSRPMIWTSTPCAWSRTTLTSGQARCSSSPTTGTSWNGCVTSPMRSWATVRASCCPAGSTSTSSIGVVVMPDRPSRNEPVLPSTARGNPDQTIPAGMGLRTTHRRSVRRSCVRSRRTWHATRARWTRRRQPWTTCTSRWPRQPRTTRNSPSCRGRPMRCRKDSTSWRLHGSRLPNRSSESSHLQKRVARVHHAPGSNRRGATFG